MYFIGCRVCEKYEGKGGIITDIQSFNGSKLYIIRMIRGEIIRLFKDEIKRMRAGFYKCKKKRDVR
jgi:hypothetical protein